MSSNPQWKVNRIDYPRKKDVSFEVVDDIGAIVCQTIMREIATEQELIASDEKHTKIVAAAPDMLAALKAIVDAWLSPLEKRALKVEMCEAARTAIAKAERGQ